MKCAALPTIVAVTRDAGERTLRPAVRVVAVIACLASLAACDPRATGTAPPGVSQEKYERHKANRESYMYQGL